jgi:hypothetical protein
VGTATLNTTRTRSRKLPVHEPTCHVAAGGRWIAAEVVKQIVGSDEYAAYDAWVARHRG